jgi:hypothetical protein
MANCLTKMVKKAQSNQLITSLASNLIPNGVAILQYADDTIVCLKNDMVGARNMKLLLYLYELMSWLKVNFTKSEVVMVNGVMILQYNMLRFFIARHAISQLDI